MLNRSAPLVMPSTALRTLLPAKLTRIFAVVVDIVDGVYEHLFDWSYTSEFGWGAGRRVADDASQRGFS